MNKPGLKGILNISPEHMSEFTRDRVKGVIDKAPNALYHLDVYPIGTDGYILKFDEYDVESHKTPPDLKAIMRYAKMHGTNMVYFDENTEMLENLTKYMKIAKGGESH